MTSTPTRTDIPPAGVDTGEHGGLDTLTWLLADAFLAQAPSQWLVPDVRERQIIFRGYFGLLAEHNLAGAGWVDADEPGMAAMLWYPVNEAGGEPDLVDEDTYEDDLARIAGEHLDRFNRMDADMHPSMPTDIAYAYLGFAVTSPPEQGKGRATELLTARHRQLDADGMHAFLIASTPDSARLYRRLGYVDHGEEIRLGGHDGPPMFPMLRTPQTG
jgi:hypothetical protein